MATYTQESKILLVFNAPSSKRVRKGEPTWTRLPARMIAPSQLDDLTSNNLDVCLKNYCAELTSPVYFSRADSRS
jgi:hypothetical protein